MDKYEVLKQYFGHTSFRKGQEDLIDAIAAGRDALGIMPTGAGKSLCFQIPALMSSGITLVVSPLISLMKDQVEALIQSGVKAAYINSSLSTVYYYETIRRAKLGMFKIIYIAPERLEAPDFVEFCTEADISIIAIDEAHCVSHWGQDFRPSYLKIINFIDIFPDRPAICAFTATATDTVKNDIIRILKLKNPLTITTGFDRENLYFEVQKPEKKNPALMRLIKENHDRNIIIYCSTRKNVEKVTEMLLDNGFNAARYHAGLPSDERQKSQEDFIYDRKNIIVATNAFGMGIDKSNVSLVIHYNMPKDLESYYQEAGRAGRDGEPAQCILLYSKGDVVTNQYLIEHREPNAELSLADIAAVKALDEERLKMMTFYSTSHKCLRKFILNYFGEESNDFCDNCSVCLGNYEKCDITVSAQKIISCIFRVNQVHETATTTLVTQILTAKAEEKYRKLSTFGIMSDTEEQNIAELIDFLITSEYIDKDENDTLIITNLANDFIRQKQRLYMRRKRQDWELEAAKAEKKPKTALLADVDLELLAQLKNLRKDLADKVRLPAYTIFTDATLHDMCRRLPLNMNDFLEVAGVGKTKASKYGEAFIKIIQNYSAGNADKIVKKETVVLKDKMKQPFALSPEQITAIKYSNESISVSNFASLLNNYIDAYYMQKLKRVDITNWLKANGYLEEVSVGEKNNLVATEKGNDIGIQLEKRFNHFGVPYQGNFYDIEAQKFIVAHLDDINEFAKNKDKSY